MNVLVVLVDDIRADLLPFMPWTWGVLRAGGTHFPNARCNVPICQAARIGFLSGQYATGALNGVYTNSGGFGQVDTQSVPIWLQAAGVKTGMFGKAPNLYRQTAPRAGWDSWEILVTGEQSAYAYTVPDGAGGTFTPGVHEIPYMAGRVRQFITAHKAEPWFAWWTPTAPHVQQVAPFEQNPLPADCRAYPWVYWDLDLLPDSALPTQPSWVAARQQITDAQQSTCRRSARLQLRELRGVDHELRLIHDHLEAEGLLDQTLILFMSDNGAFYGEKRETNVLAAGKDSPWECAAKVPLVAYGPGVPAGLTNWTPVAHVQDAAATVLDVFGATGVDPDGVSLLELIAQPDLDRATLYNRHATDDPMADGVATIDRKFVRWVEGTGTPPLDFTTTPADEFELYDLSTDPLELDNLAQNPAWLSERNRLEGLLDEFMGGGA